MKENPNVTLPLRNPDGQQQIVTIVQLVSQWLTSHGDCKERQTFLVLNLFNIGLLRIDVTKPKRALVGMKSFGNYIICSHQTKKTSPFKEQKLKYSRDKSEVVNFKCLFDIYIIWQSYAKLIGF